MEKQVNQHLQDIKRLEQVKVGGQSSLSPQQEQTIENVDFTTGIELAEELELNEIEELELEVSDVSEESECYSSGSELDLHADSKKKMIATQIVFARNWVIGQ